MLNRLKEIEFRDPLLDRMYKSMILLYNFCLNNFGDNVLVKDYIKRFATAMEETNLLQDTPKNEEHNEEEKERIDHPLTTSTSNSKPVTNVFNSRNDSYDALFLENYSEEDSCLAFESIDIDELNMRPIELPLECFLPDYIDKVEASRLLIENLVNGRTHF